MSYIEQSEWDENEEELEREELEESEVVLQSERESFLSNLNSGIHYQRLELNNLI